MSATMEAEGPVPQRGRRRWRRALGALSLLAMVASLGACGDADSDDPDDSAAEVVESAMARGLAEALRAVMVIDDLDEDQHRRDVEVIEESIADLPVDPEIRGVLDSDGDGRDDDGKVEVEVEAEVACVTIAEDGEVDVTGGAC